MANEWRTQEVEINGQIKIVEILPWQSENKNDILEIRKSIIKEFNYTKTCLIKRITFPLRKSPSGYGFISDPPQRQLWKLDLLTTDEWIDLVAKQGFPDPGTHDPSIGHPHPAICCDVPAFWQEVRQLLGELFMKNKALSLASINSFQISLDNWGSDNLTLSDMDKIQRLNERYFRIKYEVEHLPAFGEKRIEELENEMRNIVLNHRVEKQYMALGYGDL
jgi:hypothetical protein